MLLFLIRLLGRSRHPTIRRLYNAAITLLTVENAELSMNEKRKLLLKKAIENDGKLTMSMASQLYASKDSAKSAIAAFEFQDYVERQAPGVFRVVKAPEEIKEAAKKELEA